MRLGVDSILHRCFFLHILDAQTYLVPLFIHEIAQRNAVLGIVSRKGVWSKTREFCLILQRGHEKEDKS